MAGLEDVEAWLDASDKNGVSDVLTSIFFVLKRGWEMPVLCIFYYLMFQNKASNVAGPFYLYLRF